MARSESRQRRISLEAANGLARPPSSPWNLALQDSRPGPTERGASRARHADGATGRQPPRLLSSVATVACRPVHPLGQDLPGRPRLRFPLVLAVAIGLGAGCGFQRGMPDGSGTIECVQVQLAPLVGGRLLDFPPREGARLKQGDLVARIDPADYELKRNEARAALAAAEAQLDLMLAGSRDEDILRSREQVALAAAAARAAAADLRRIEQVYQKRSATQKQMDDARSAAEQTAAALAAAEQAHAKAVRGNREQEIEAARALVEAARARLAQLDKAVADCRVTAPADGMVTTRVREDGEVVSAGSVLLILSRLDEVWLSLYVPESRLGQVKLGQAAWVRIDGDPKAYEGKVTFVSPEAEFTPRNVQTPEERAKLVYRIKITLPNPDGVFKPGMPADGYLEQAP